MRVKLTIEYDGTAFRGWATQPGERTVEGELRHALDRLYGPGSGGLTVAGRTDAGVHAVANVVSTDVEGGPPPGRAAGALNAFLPADLAVSSVVEVRADFHARFDARSRSYRYRVWRRRERSALEATRALWYPGPIDLARRCKPPRRSFSASTTSRRSRPPTRSTRPSSARSRTPSGSSSTRT